jgi:hypothetical protein
MGETWRQKTAKRMVLESTVCPCGRRIQITVALSGLGKTVGIISRGCASLYPWLLTDGPARAFAGAGY